MRSNKTQASQPKEKGLHQQLKLNQLKEKVIHLNFPLDITKDTIAMAYTVKLG